MRGNRLLRAVCYIPVMAGRRIVERGQKFDDSKATNSWRWEWAEHVVNSVTERIGEHIRKIDSSGLAFCTLCKSDLNYGPRGRVALEDHLKRKKHKSEKSALKGCSVISG